MNSAKTLNFNGGDSRNHSKMSNYNKEVLWRFDDEMCVSKTVYAILLCKPFAQCASKSVF